MTFYFDRRTSLLNLVLEDAAKMEHPMLLACTFHFPDTAAHRLARKLDEGVISRMVLYTELHHRNNRGWQEALKKRGVELHNIPIHAKCAVLKDGKNTVVYLSSNNWLNDHVFEFSVRYEGDEALRLAYMIAAALPSGDGNVQ